MRPGLRSVSQTWSRGEEKASLMEGSQMVALRLFLTFATALLLTTKTAVTSRNKLGRIISLENTGGEV